VLGTQFPAALAAARTGAEWAWISIYRDLSPVVLGYLRARRATEPEDLLGEVFLQVARDLPAFDGSERDFRAWAFVRSRRPTTEPYEHRRWLPPGPGRRRSRHRRERLKPPTGSALPQPGGLVSREIVDKCGMRERLAKFLLDAALPVTCPDEDFFVAGPSAVTTPLAERRRRRALLADVRRRRRLLAA
jgi:hypothetical protein